MLQYLLAQWFTLFPSPVLHLLLPAETDVDLGVDDGSNIRWVPVLRGVFWHQRCLGETLPHRVVLGLPRNVLFTLWADLNQLPVEFPRVCHASIDVETVLHNFDVAGFPRGFRYLRKNVMNQRLAIPTFESSNPNP